MSDKLQRHAKSDDVLELEDEAVAALLRQAAPRPMPSTEQREAIRRAVHFEWKATVKKRRGRNNMLYSLAASALIATLAISMLSQNTPTPTTGVTVASLSRQFGEVNVSPQLMSGGSAVATGQTISTGDDSGVALAWANGGSLRMDRNTQLRIESAEEVYLVAGRLYFDSHPAVTNSNVATNNLVLAINTASGLVTPLGTRYQATYSNDELTVAVREGQVVVESDRVRQHASAREQITVAPNGVTSRSRIDVYGAAWGWVEDSGPAFNSEGRSVYEFLLWVGRESGREIHFGNSDTETIARRTSIVGFGTLHMSPTESLAIVMPSTGLRWKMLGGEIQIQH